MTEVVNDAQSREPRFAFIKGGDDVPLTSGGTSLDWKASANSVRDQLAEAMNARNVAFLFGSGCSSFVRGGIEHGISTMQPMAKAYLDTIGDPASKSHVTQAERDILLNRFGVNVADTAYTQSLEKLMEILFSAEYLLRAAPTDELKEIHLAVTNIIQKVIIHIVGQCTKGRFSSGVNSVLNIYQLFFRKLLFRDRTLPRPWIFSANYDLLCERAMDRLGIPSCNGFSGIVERRFNPSTFRYSLAEQLDISSRKWSAVDSFVYLCKLHGSVNWIEDRQGLFPFRELQEAPPADQSRIMIYPTPAKQNASFGSPYSDLFREFQSRIVREQSVLFVLGYGFGDEHINNVIFQALTIPSFRVVVFARPDADGVLKQLRDLRDPRVWIIGGDGETTETKAHYFDSFVQHFMPEPSGDKINTAVAKVLENLLTKGTVDPPGSAPDVD